MRIVTYGLWGLRQLSIGTLWIKSTMSIWVSWWITLFVFVSGTLTILAE
jgi:hypothetical protein